MHLMSGFGTNRPSEGGQSMSALPGYFRHQLVPLLPGRHDFDAEIPDGAFDLGMPEQELNGPEIARPSIDQGSLGTPQRMRAEQPRV